MPVMKGFAFMEHPGFGCDTRLALIQSLICLRVEWMAALPQVEFVAILACDGMQLIIYPLVLRIIN